MANPITWVMAAGFGLGPVACEGEPPKAGASASPETNTRFMAERGKLSTRLQEDLARLGSKGIPVDIVFDQGPGVLQ